MRIDFILFHFFIFFLDLARISIYFISSFEFAMRHFINFRHDFDKVFASQCNVMWRNNESSRRICKTSLYIVHILFIIIYSRYVWIAISRPQYLIEFYHISNGFLFFHLFRTLHRAQWIKKVCRVCQNVCNNKWNESLHQLYQRHIVIQGVHSARPVTVHVMIQLPYMLHPVEIRRIPIATF